MGVINLLETPDVLRNKKVFEFFDDFIGGAVLVGDATTDIIQWVVTADAGGVQGHDLDGVGGVYSIKCDGDDNDEAYIESREIALFANLKPLKFACRAQYTEANTDDANVILGLMNAPGADSLLDNGGGPAASYSGMVFFKADGDTVWSCESSLAGTQVTTKLTAANSLDKVAKTAGGAAYQEFEIDFVPTSSTAGYVIFTIDGVVVARHEITYTSATEMALVAGIKAGGANEETILLDYIGVWGKR